MHEVAVLGVGMYRFGKHIDVPLADMAREAGLEALADANMSFRDVQAAYTAYINGPMMSGVRILKEFGLTGIPTTHMENASASGAAAFREAYLAVAGGHYDIAMVLGFDRMNRGLSTPRPPVPTSVEGAILPAAYFAMWAMRRMHDYGTTPETLAMIAAKNWNHGALNEKADRQSDHKVTPEEVLASRMIAEPLTSMMSTPADAGAACVIIGRKELAQKYNPGRKVVTVAASALQSEKYTPGHVFMGPVVGPPQITADTAREAYEKAGVGPEDLDLVEVHEAFAIEELMYYELLGICPPGEGDRLVHEGATALGGRIPFSTSGGLIACGHPGGPTGLAQIREITLQLRGEAGTRQVDGAKVGLAHMLGAGSVCTVHIFKT
jgi:acetyl-CoA acetyltransferase